MLDKCEYSPEKNSKEAFFQSYIFHLLKLTQTQVPTTALRALLEHFCN